jgi:hypothetical protein
MINILQAEIINLAIFIIQAIEFLNPFSETSTYRLSLRSVILAYEGSQPLLQILLLFPGIIIKYERAAYQGKGNRKYVPLFEKEDIEIFYDEDEQRNAKSSKPSNTTSSTYEAEKGIFKDATSPSESIAQLRDRAITDSNYYFCQMLISGDLNKPVKGTKGNDQSTCKSFCASRKLLYLRDSDTTILNYSYTCHLDGKIIDQEKYGN